MTNHCNLIQNSESQMTSLNFLIKKVQYVRVGHLSKVIYLVPLTVFGSFNKCLYCSKEHLLMV